MVLVVTVVSNVVNGMLSDVVGALVVVCLEEIGLTVGLDVDVIKVGTNVVVWTMVVVDGAGVVEDVNSVGADVVDDIKVGTRVVVGRVELTVVVVVAMVVDDIKVGTKVVVGNAELTVD